MLDEWLERYSAISRQIRLAAGSALLLAVIGGYFLSIYSDNQAQLQSQQEALATLQARRAEKRVYAENLPRYQARFEELQSDLDKAHTLLPDTADVPQFLAQLSAAAHEVGLTIERFEPRSESVTDFYAEITFKVQVRGSYHEMAMFIDQVAKIQRIVNVGAITMNAPKLDNKKVSITGAFIIKTFRFLSEEAAAEYASKHNKAGGK